MATGLTGAIGEFAQSLVEVENSIVKEFATILHLPMEERYVLDVALTVLHVIHNLALLLLVNIQTFMKYNSKTSLFELYRDLFSSKVPYGLKTFEYF